MQICAVILCRENHKIWNATENASWISKSSENVHILAKIDFDRAENGAFWTSKKIFATSGSNPQDRVVVVRAVFAVASIDDLVCYENAVWLHHLSRGQPSSHPRSIPLFLTPQTNPAVVSSLGIWLGPGPLLHSKARIRVSTSKLAIPCRDVPLPAPSGRPAQKIKGRTLNSSEYLFRK